jgi:hypothetical protein
MPKAAKKSDDNRNILEYALGHLEREAAEIQTRIDHVKRQLGRSGNSAAASVASAAGAASTAPAAAGKKRVLSAAARRRIAAAQKKRWAEHRKAKAAKAKA